MKILFLDIDGVVLPGRAYGIPGQTKPIVKTFDPCSVALLNSICEQGGYKIVIHSSWLRYWIPSDGEGGVKGHCIEEGVLAKHFHETEPECSGQIHWRYDRVIEWLDRHPEVTEFVILDDEPCEEGWVHQSRLINTDFDEGITVEIYRRLTTV
jgi:hypothetical protein